MSLKSDLGKRIKHLRKSAEITQEKLAEMINMDVTSLSKIETGRNYPQPETVEKISNALNIDISKLFLFESFSSNEQYVNAINENIKFIKNNREKLKFLYDITTLLI